MAEREALPEVNISAFKGAVTKINPEGVDFDQLYKSINTNYFSVYGAVKKFRGTKRVLATQYKEGGIVQRIPWIDYYKNPTLLTSDSKQTIFQGGTKLHKLEGSSYSTLDTGYRTDIFRTSARFDDYLYITGQDFDIIGRKDKMVKYNGYTISNWGVTAPGFSETVVETFNDQSSFNKYNVTLANETEVTWDGTSVKATPNPSITSYSFHKILSSPVYVPTNSINRLGMYVKINPGSLSNLLGSGASLVFHFSSSNTGVSLSDPGNFKFEYTIGQLTEGWNQLLFDFYSATSPFDPSVTAIRSFQVTVNLKSAAVSPTLYFSHMFVRDSGTPDVVSAASLQTLVDFDSTAGWSNINATTTSSLNSTTFIQGSASIQMNKINDTINVIGIENSSVSIDLSDTADDKLHLYVYIPTPANINAVKLKLGTTSSNYVEYTNTSTWSTGWNHVEFTKSAPTAQVGTGVNFSNPVTYISPSIVFIQTETIENGYLVDDFFHAVTTSGGVLNGTYSYRIVYETIDGLLSNAGPISASVTLPVGGGSIVLNNIPVSSDPQVIRRRIYRTVGDGSEYSYVATIEDNSTTSFTDAVPDGSLLPLPPPEAGRDDFDNSPPPWANLVQVWRRTVFLSGDPLNPNILYFSAPDDPEAFPLINAFELDSRITSIFSNYLGFIVVTEDSVWRILGENPNFILEKISDGIGSVGPRATASGKLQGWMIDLDGVRLFDFSQIQKISENIADVFYNQPKDYIHKTFGIHSRKNNCLMVLMPDSNGNYTEIWNYEYTGDDMQVGWWSKIEPPDSLNLICGMEVEISDGELKVYVGSDDGMIFELFNSTNNNWELSDGTSEAVRLELQTVYMRRKLGDEGLERGLQAGSRIKPRFFEIRTTEENSKETNWTITVDTANGVSPRSKLCASNVLDVVVPYQSTIKRQAIPAHNAGETCRFGIVNEDLDVDLTLYGVSMRYNVLPGQTPLEE